LLDSKVFFKAFQVNFWDYKALTLEKLLEDSEKKPPFLIRIFPFLKSLFRQKKLAYLSSIVGYSKTDYQRMLRVEIHQNMLHAIDTLFTLIFSFKPKDRIVDDLNFWHTYSEKNFFYDKIDSIATKQDGSLDFLNTHLDLSDGATCTLGRYIFYLWNTNRNFDNQINSSVESIKKALVSLAQELSDRGEYNSYKHGLRYLQAFTTFKLGGKEVMELDKSLTFVRYNKETKQPEYETIALDTDRDLRITSMTTWLIHNIIAARRSLFFGEKPKFLIMTDEQIKAWTKPTTKGLFIKFKLKFTD